MRVVVNPITGALVPVKSQAYERLKSKIAVGKLPVYNVAPAVARARAVYVQNPATGRLIRVGGRVFLDLQARGTRFQGRHFRTTMKKLAAKKKSLRRSKSPTRGWAKVAPRRGSPRAALYNACGPKCFLMPNAKRPSQSKFPVCKKCSGKRCSCKPDCRGIQSAYNRARQYKYNKVAARANRMLKEKCGK